MKKVLKKIGKIVSNNILGFIIGSIVFGSIGVYAATTVASSIVTYDNSTSGGSSTNVQGAVDELYKLANTSHCASVSGNTVTFKVGDYVKMTPTSTSYTTDTSKTGYTSSQTINPSELNLWRVIRINSDGTVDMVSENASSTSVYFRGQTGYKNLVGYLNTIAHQYENKCYTVDARHMGYSTQTPYLTDTASTVDSTSTTAPWTSSAGSSTVESQGGGDKLYTTDTDLVRNALGTLKAYKPSGTTTYYWLASRRYNYISSSYWYYDGLSVSYDGSLSTRALYRYESGFNTYSSSGAVRPILTLKSGIQATGSGTSADPYVLP